MATKKDYIRTAAILANVRAPYAPHWDANLFRALDDVAVAFADSFGHERAQFNRVRFLSAAGASASTLLNEARNA